MNDREMVMEDSTQRHEYNAYNAHPICNLHYHVNNMATTAKAD